VTGPAVGHAGRLCFIGVEAMSKKRLITAAAVLLMLILNSAAFIILKKADTEPQNHEIAVSDSVPSQTDMVYTVPSESDAVTKTVSWQGAQTAAAAEGIVLYSDQECTQPTEREIEAGSRVIICRQEEDKCYIRVGSDRGWVTADKVEPAGEPTVYQPVSTGDAVSVNVADIAPRLDKVAKSHGSIGVQIAVINDGAVSHLYEYGYSNRAGKIPMTSDKKIRAASVSKVIVAMGILSMQDMDLLSIDEDVSTYWGSSIKNPNHPNMPITLRHILTHTSSMKDFGYKNRATSKLEQNLRKRKSYTSKKPGTTGAYDYNNSAYCAAGAIAGRAADDNFDRYMRKYFFEPMGIDASFCAGNLQDTSKVAPIYNDGVVTMKPGDLIETRYYGGVGDDYTLYAGGLVISAKDLAQMVCVLLGDGGYNGMYYMQKDTVAMMLEPQLKLKKYDQCIALRYQDDMLGGRSLYYHNGNMLGVYSLLCFDPQTKDGMVIITNGSKPQKQTDDVYNVCYDLALIASELWEN